MDLGFLAGMQIGECEPPREEARSYARLQFAIDSSSRAVDEALVSCRNCRLCSWMACRAGDFLPSLHLPRHSGLPSMSCTCRGSDGRGSFQARFDATFSKMAPFIILLVLLLVEPTHRDLLHRRATKTNQPHHR